MTGHARSRLLNCPVGGRGWDYILHSCNRSDDCCRVLSSWPHSLGMVAISPDCLAAERFSLGGLFVYFSIIAVLIGMAAAIARGTG